MIASIFGLFPSEVWWSLLTVSVVGIVVLWIAHRVCPVGSLRHDVVRDIGIALIVAAVVSGIYEYSTRSVEEHETVLETISRAMSAFIPDSVWVEVQEQILRRHAIRRNVEIELKIRRVAEMPDGKSVPMPPDKAVLWMSYSYDLEGLGDGSSTVSVEHELDYFMKNDKLGLPRFERVVIVGPNAEIQRLYEGADLQRIYDGKGLIRLDGADSVKLPPRDSGRRVRIITERQEIVNVPGYYCLVMRELTTKNDDSAEPTVKVTVSELPSDIQAEMNTYYPPHSFVTPDKTVWTLDGTLLPGQGMSLVLTTRKPM